MDFNSDLIPENLRPGKNDTGLQRFLGSIGNSPRRRPGLGNSNPSAGSATPTTRPSLRSSTSIQSSNSTAQTETRPTSVETRSPNEETPERQPSKKIVKLPIAVHLTGGQVKRAKQIVISDQELYTTTQTDTRYTTEETSTRQASETPSTISSPTDEETEGMSARPPRARGGRGGVNDQGEEQALWNDFRGDFAQLQSMEQRSAVVVELIFEKQERMQAFKDLGKKIPISDIDELDKLYRENVSIAENMKTILGSDGGSGAVQNLGILKALVENNENTREDVTTSRGSTSRDSHSRSAVDPFDGPSASPGPSAAENRQVRKLGGGNARTGSQPPRNLDVIIPSEPAERNADKKKSPILLETKLLSNEKWGIVTRVIGEGKSRRYEVRDPYPDDLNQDNLYKSSASQMVPIPKPNLKLDDYEVGKRVLALYPGTSTFYRADVKRMVDGENGREVLLLFEEEIEGQQEKQVDRQHVLDHKGV
ncbi:hypothetical protein GLAREA_03168 [Glarea lozoyensis ATCC 20868]|uniref:SGF29 C-terminal domain-containing protein n=1 Tax=Glarea lozoyensis (strain ATCC 20868 / MF5171) TaxID=1116229 RepID=S3DL24_GLAL2|nr:uncharacterized protein GLAREA_03168 [Glarea lozoyensis ATCC 20868]EPE27253.1 hypothetical protein GLAREA_03168 [Glarea lozoyensis ATCC 20868]